MALNIPPEFAQAAFIFTGAPGTSPFVTTIGVFIGASQTNGVDEANTMKQDFVSSWASRISAALTLQKVQLTLSNGVGGFGSVDSDTAPSPMANGSTDGPIAMACILRKQSATLGRSGRGRMFLPGTADEGRIGQSGELSASLVSDIQAAADSWYTSLTTPAGALSFQPYILHNEDTPGAATPSFITGFSVAPQVGWIRGRIR